VNGEKVMRNLFYFGEQVEGYPVRVLNESICGCVFYRLLYSCAD
jgi:hypothetical protein